MRIDWTDYLRVHAERRNLLIHLIAVPLFVASVISLPLYLIRGDYVSGVIAIIIAFGAMAMQGKGHALESEAPRPNASPLDFLRRWFKEQFYVFPVFLLSGRWWRQFTSEKKVQTVQPDVQHFYDEQTGTLTYVVSDPQSRAAAIIDPVLGFCVVSGRTNTRQADEICAYVEQHELQLVWILETHAHADHLSAAQHLKAKLGGTVAIGEGICKVQEHFGSVFNLQPPFAADGHQFDHLFRDNESFLLGNIQCRVMHTPGHTSDSVTYLVGNFAFIGDSLFMVDSGTARCDFPGGDAGLLYDSIQKLLSLPDDTMLCMCHDYPPENRSLRYDVTVREQKEQNIHVGGGTGKEDFVALRKHRDETLDMPKLILPSIQVNIRAGHLPEAEKNEISYIKIPLDVL